MPGHQWRVTFRYNVVAILSLGMIAVLLPPVWIVVGFMAYFASLCLLVVWYMAAVHKRALEETERAAVEATLLELRAALRQRSTNDHANETR